MSMNRETRRKFKSALEEFAMRTGKSVEDGIDEIAMSAGRELAKKVQPYGLTDTQGNKFIGNIGKQIDYAWMAVNLGAAPATGDMRAAHYAMRMAGGRKGRGKYPFPKIKKERGQRWLNLISVSEKEAYKRKQQAKAGQAKGAWVSATNKIGSTKLSGIAAWISRHDKSGYGTAKKTGEGLKYKVSMENTTPYLSSIQSNKKIAQAIAYGLKNGMKRLEKVIEGEIKKANKLLSQ
tara:strand:+ start:914 stop:1618 length:705 start_codon:yes stop_codon:yes gene_type:complete